MVATGGTGRIPAPDLGGTGVNPVGSTGEIPLPLLEIFPPPTGEIPVIKETIKKINTTNKQSEGDPFDSVPESLKKMGFIHAHLDTLIAQAKFSENEILLSLDAFAFDLQFNGKAKKIKGHPLTYITSILRKGNHYLPAHNYESPEVRQQTELLKARDQQLKKQRQIEQQIAEVEFERWIGRLSKEATLSMIPPLIRKSSHQIQIAFLKGAFLKRKEGKMSHS